MRLSDAASRSIITVGGIGTILAISMVGAFLVWVIVPLFSPASIKLSARLPLPARWPTTNPVCLATDDQQAVGFGLTPSGSAIVFRLDDGSVLDQRELFTPGPKVTACSPPTDSEEAAFGFADGTVCLGTVGVRTSPVLPTTLPEDLCSLSPGRSAMFRGGLLTRTTQGEFQWTRVSANFDDPFPPQVATRRQPAGQAVVLLDYIRRPAGTVYAALTADGRLRLNSVRERTNLLTDEVIRDVTSCELPFDPSRGQPLRLLINNVGDSVYVVWPDGHLARYDARNSDKPVLAEELYLVEAAQGCRITIATFLIGRTTLLCGDSTGRVRGWFPAQAAGGRTTTADGVRMVWAHEYETGSKSAVSAIAVSARSRVFAVGQEDGTITLFQATTANRIGHVATDGRGRVQALAIAPKDDGLVAITAEGMSAWRMDLRYPETTVPALFGKVWYEGAAQPEYAWQSTGGADAFEPKLSLIPLIVGTLKATFYSMLFGVPLALLAAVYTSEFLHPRAKARIKPTVEMMASLPSVVLGFIAGLVLAPLVETHLAAVLAGIFTVPLVFLAAGHLWQILPPSMGLRLARFRFLFLLAALPVGLLVASPAGALIQSLLFAGDIKHWLADRNAGSGLGGWIILFLPLASVVAALLVSRWVNPWLRHRSRSWSHAVAAIVESAKFAGVMLLGIVLAVVSGLALQSIGWDPRGTFYGGYDQRNALVVGFIMGFAIIPIIYTIADDALSAVPDHLRAASLGVGATPWQTAIRITIPTAMSGLFSALMVGLGRAVGETMIVLMASGSTPIMDWNIFNGFRTLSANIAIEMPEAVRDSLHYRTLFLCAVVLFAMTFVLNTVAEVVRQRFRRRAYQL